MPEWTCEQCKLGFRRSRSGNRSIRFCSQTCYHRWRAAHGITTGQFQPGLVPWNKNKKGLHLSAHSEFKKGIVPKNKMPVGSICVRLDKLGKQRAWVKTSNPSAWKLRATMVWESSFGLLPRGLFVHHVNCDTLDDSVTNLAAVSRAAHLMIHRPDFEEKRRAGLLRSKRCASRIPPLL